MKYLLILFLLPTVLFSQDNNSTSTIRFHHLSATFGSGQGEDDIDLLGGGLEFAVAMNQHILKLSYLGGAQVDFPGGNSVGDFREWSLLYGREFSLNDWLSFDPYAGLGLFGVRVPKIEDPSKTNMENSLGIPLEGNIRFAVWEHFSFGGRVRHNFNSDMDVTYFGGFLQYRF